MWELYKLFEKPYNEFILKGSQLYYIEEYTPYNVST